MKPKIYKNFDLRYGQLEPAIDSYERKYYNYYHKRLDIELREYILDDPATYYKNLPKIKYYYNITTGNHHPTISELNCYASSRTEESNLRNPDTISDEEFNLYILKYSL